MQTIKLNVTWKLKTFGKIKTLVGKFDVKEIPAILKDKWGDTYTGNMFSVVVINDYRRNTKLPYYIAARFTETCTDGKSTNFCYQLSKYRDYTGNNKFTCNHPSQELIDEWLKK
jgi:hypothetical protein